ncbi:MAG: DegV family protein [Clostridia bacterium]|nr:DegV family protein [Clostridia bacterium]
MRTVKIVADSSANMLSLPHVAFASAPLKIITADREFTDGETLDVRDMIAYFDTYKGTSKTSCPNPSDWLAAFGDADDIFCVTITSGLSGSYNAACAAKAMYEAENEGKRVCVIDSLSAGPELTLIIEKLEEWIGKGVSFDDICVLVRSYTEKTGLLFMLESLKNFAANGRVSPAIAKVVGFLGIWIVGKASEKGQLEPLHKCRGQERSLETLFAELKKNGLSKGKVRIAHCENEAAATALQKAILAQIPAADVSISTCRGLCSYYAEKGGLLVGFEKI